MEKRGKVLIIEDNPGWSDHLREYLQDEGFHVVVAKTKEEALQLLERENFHFATVDLKLDEGTLSEKNYEGWEVINKIFDIGANRMMPIMVITGFEDAENQRKAIHEYKASYFMGKSKFDKKKFTDTVIKAVERRGVRFKDDYKS